MGGPEVIIVAVIWGIPALFVWLMVRRPSDRSVAAFARTYEVPLTSHNVTQLRRYIQWIRRWRVGGAAATTLLAVLTSAVTARGGFGWFPLVAGYSIGSLLGEVTRPAERTTNAAIARLRPRRIRDYVKPGFLVAVAVVFAASLVPAVFLLVTNPQRPWVDTVETPGLRPQDWFVIALTAVSFATAIASWFGGRIVAQAPAPADSPDRQAVRHAIRSATLMSIVGGAAMMIGIVGTKLGDAARQLNDLADGSGIVSWILRSCTVVCLLATTFGGLLTLTSIPRVAPFLGPLPPVPFPEPRPGP